MLCVPYSQFNLILLAYVIIVVTDESIFAYSNSNISLPIHCSRLAVFDYTVALNTHSDVMSSVRNTEICFYLLLEKVVFFVTLKLNVCSAVAHC